MGYFAYNNAVAPEQAFTFKGGVYSTLLVPGSTSASAFNVNSLGQIVGGFWDNAGYLHGFVDNAGTFTQVDYPGAYFTEVYDMNEAGDMVGWWQDTYGLEHAFINRGGTFTSIEFPGSEQSWAAGINAAGEVVGFFDDTNDREHGFISARRCLHTTGCAAVHCDERVWSERRGGDLGVVFR